MLEFIIHCDLFNYIIYVLALINLITCLFLHEKPISFLDNGLIKDNNSKIINTFTFLVSIIYTLIIVFYLLFKQKIIYSLLFLVAIIIYIVRIINNYVFKKLSLTKDEKRMYTFASLAIPTFFTSDMYLAYTRAFSNIIHSFKETLLIIFLLSKILFIVFFFLINIAILISNIKLIICDKINKIMKFLNNICNNDYVIKAYGFSLYKKKGTIFYLIVDMIIYFITFPIICILSIILLIYQLLLFIPIGIIYLIFLSFSNFDSKRFKVIELILRISLIIALIIVFIVILYNKNIFSNEIANIYELITTVILIPIIYDAIKNNSIKQ